MQPEELPPEIRAALDKMSVWSGGKRLEYRTTFTPVDLINPFDIQEMVTLPEVHTKKHHTAVQRDREPETYRAHPSRN